MSAHVCHARGCSVPVPPRLLMCKRHWFMVPATLRRRVWAAYVPGQEVRKDPTAAYLSVMQEAIDAVAEKERAAADAIRIGGTRIRFASLAEWLAAWTYVTSRRDGARYTYMDQLLELLPDAFVETGSLEELAELDTVLRVQRDQPTLYGGSAQRHSVARPETGQQRARLINALDRTRTRHRVAASPKLAGGMA